MPGGGHEWLVRQAGDQRIAGPGRHLQRQLQQLCLLQGGPRRRRGPGDGGLPPRHPSCPSHGQPQLRALPHLRAGLSASFCEPAAAATGRGFAKGHATPGRRSGTAAGAGGGIVLAQLAEIIGRIAPGAAVPGGRPPAAAVGLRGPGPGLARRRDAAGPCCGWPKPPTGPQSGALCPAAPALGRPIGPAPLLGHGGSGPGAARKPVPLVARNRRPPAGLERRSPCDRLLPKPGTAGGRGRFGAAAATIAAAGLAALVGGESGAIGLGAGESVAGGGGVTSLLKESIRDCVSTQQTSQHQDQANRDGRPSAEITGPICDLSTQSGCSRHW